jgi:hypothetical protein
MKCPYCDKEMHDTGKHMQHMETEISYCRAHMVCECEDGHAVLKIISMPKNAFRQMQRRGSGAVCTI